MEQTVSSPEPARLDARAVATEDVADVCAVRDADVLLVDDRPRLGVDVEGEEVRVALLGEDDFLENVSQNSSGVQRNGPGATKSAS